MGRERDAVRGMGAVAYGREITVDVGGPDEFGQFAVSLSVDGKERYVAYFIDKSGDAQDTRESAL